MGKLPLLGQAVDGLGRVRDGLPVGHDLGAGDDGEGTEHLADVAPPRLAEAAVPVDRHGQAVGEAGLLIPAQLPQLGAVDGVPVVVEGPVVRVLDPLGQLLVRVVRDAHLGEQLGAQRQVANLVVRPDVVDLAQLALVQDRVERVRRVAREEVSARRRAVAVQDDRLSSVEQAGELWDDLCKRATRG